MLTCPQCGASRGLHTETTYLIATTGDRRRLRTCRHCGYKMRTLQTPGGVERLAQELIGKRPRKRSKKLTAEQVVEIRVAVSRGDRPGELAPRYGVSRQAIDQLVAGQTWRDVGGPVRRSRPAAIEGGPTCEGCADWCFGSCSFDFPEAGSAFAAECDLYSPRSQATSAA
jgi:hypothetical protein